MSLESSCVNIETDRNKMTVTVEITLKSAASKCCTCDVHMVLSEPGLVEL